MIATATVVLFIPSQFESRDRTRFRWIYIHGRGSFTDNPFFPSHLVAIRQIVFTWCGCYVVHALNMHGYNGPCPCWRVQLFLYMTDRIITCLPNILYTRYLLYFDLFFAQDSEKRFHVCHLWSAIPATVSPSRWLSRRSDAGSRSGRWSHDGTSVQHVWQCPRHGNVVANEAHPGSSRICVRLIFSFLFKKKKKTRSGKSWKKKNFFGSSQTDTIVIFGRRRSFWGSVIIITGAIVTSPTTKLNLH